MAIQFNEEKSARRIGELQRREAEGLAQAMADKFGLPYIDLSQVNVNTDALRLIPETAARAAGLAGFKLVGRTVHLALTSPDQPAAETIFAKLKEDGYQPSLYLTSKNSLERAWGRYSEISEAVKATAGVIEIAGEEIAPLTAKLKTLADAKQAIAAQAETAVQTGASNIIEVILAGALITGASDIHIEPQEAGIRLRYRLDGVLEDIASIDLKVYRQALSRIKLVSGLKLNIKQTAQDGRFSIKLLDAEIEIRTSVLPSNYGESIVMRVLNPKAIAATFETLGVEARLFKIMSGEIRKPNGLILLTGPTGSGKTTTLYAFLREINDPGTKIITIEDPVEYHLAGVNQTQVNAKKGYTFLTGLRAALRQDPDVIMVGEIRDGETAATAINAALTGHLVFSTLHTNNAAGAIPRLIDLGVNAKIISSSLTLSVAQRLVRKLCPQCKREDAPKPEEKKLIDQTVTTIKRVRPDIIIPPTEKVWRPGGCGQCNQTGYRGRQGVFEAVQMTEATAQAAIKNPSEREIKIAARPQGILDMRQDGILKVLAGTTSLEELGRVVDLTAEFI